MITDDEGGRPVRLYPSLLAIAIMMTFTPTPTTIAVATESAVPLDRPVVVEVRPPVGSLVPAIGPSVIYPVVELEPELNSIESEGTEDEHEVQVLAVGVDSDLSSRVEKQSSRLSHKEEIAGATPAPTTKVNTGSIDLTDKQELMLSAGISPDDWEAADYIIEKESNWLNVESRVDIDSFGIVQGNIDAHGTCEDNPHWQHCIPEGFKEDLVVQLKWADNYVKDRYGGWQQAADFKERNNWY